MGLFAAWLVVIYIRALNLSDGDAVEARQVTVTITVIMVGVGVVLFAIDRLGPEKEDEAEPRVRLREVDRRRLAARGPR